ncbi:olfactory receptor 11A1-like [Ascaphus truei]|uniref:olfactory receptor 11A1-like n=1 Tax=Ascaphus truei TaxID=8439 RepID=UPI003F59C6C1
MLRENQTTVTEFLLLGFPAIHNFKILLFLVFLLIYIFTLAGNFLIIVLVSTSHTLRTPMYLFLSHLSLSDILLTTDVVPNMLYVIMAEGAVISLAGCITQYFLFGASTGAECFLLTVMSYDRYLAICHPLRYSAIMDFKLCCQMVFWSWFLAFMAAVSMVILICSFQICNPNVINHFFCDFAPLLEHFCSDSFIVDIVLFFFGISFFIFPFIFIVVTYICISLTILSISSVTGRQKAFSTCSSHLAIVCSYYGTLIAKYVVPSKVQSFNVIKITSLLLTVVTPLFNPIIYTVRNKEIRAALLKCISIRVQTYCEYRGMR